MAETITVYTKYRLNRKTGEITKCNPVDLSIEEFMAWIEPAIPHLANLVLRNKESKAQGKIEVNL